MVQVARVEATITAQNKLRPGLASAAAELGRFRAMQSRATTAFAAASARAQAVSALASQKAALGARAGLAAASRSGAAIVGPAALAASYKQYADVDRQISRIGITANAGADELVGVRKQMEGLASETALKTGNVTKGLEVLVSQGRSLREGLQFLPAVARTAAAAGAEVDDIAKSADAVASNFKLAGNEVQKAFDIMAEGGKAGQFELKDMAQYLPSLAPAASAAGFSGNKGLTDLVSMLQIMRKGSGSSGEAMDSMSNVFQKMESEETTKKFKKFGVDLAAGMAKGRKEGRNLVEVFEELTAQALKGDLSKLPQLFTDTQFARGMRALMTYRGEWQKLAETIGRTAEGSVGRDLARVTHDARAQIDKMFNAIENRAVQVGGVLAKLVLPLDEAVRDIEQGKNPVVNKVEEWAARHNAEIIANNEMKTGGRDEYDPATRRLVEARKEFLTRERLDSERARLEDSIAAAEKKRKAILAQPDKGGIFDWITGGTSRNETQKALDALREKEKRQPLSYFDRTNKKTFEDRLSKDIAPLDRQIASDKGDLARINELAAATSELNLRLAETDAALAKAAQPRMTLPFDGMKTDIEGLGAAGQTAGSQLADGLSTGLSRMENEANAVLSRIQQRLNALKVPTLSFGGFGVPGGFDTGKSMQELRR